MGWILAADLVHGFDGWLPLQAAAAVALADAALGVVLEAHPAAAAVTANAGGMYPFAGLKNTAGATVVQLPTSTSGDEGEVPRAHLTAV